MAASIRTVQIAIAVVNILIFALVFTSIWPFPSGDFKVNLPSASDVEWSYEDGIVHVTAPYSIDNEGFYDVEDLVITYEVTNYTHAHIHSGVLEIGTIPSGQNTSDDIEFTFPLLDLYRSGITGMVFNDDFLNFDVDVSCYYTLRLIHFHAEYRTSVPWDALIDSVDVDGITVEADEMLISYHVSTSDILDGVSVLYASLYSGSLLVAEDSDTVELGSYHRGTLSFPLPLSAVPDRIVLTISVQEFQVTESVPIDPGVLP